MNRLSRRYFWATNWTGPVCLSLFLLLMRCVYGWAFYVGGKGKLTALMNHSEEGPIQFFKELGIPAPAANAWFVSVLETVGGLLLLAGLGSRIVSLLLSATMIVALLTAHREATMGFMKEAEMMPLMRETPFWFLVTCVLVVAVGPGMFSIDALLKRFVFRLPTRRGAAAAGHEGTRPSAG